MTMRKSISQLVESIYYACLVFKLQDNKADFSRYCWQRGSYVISDLPHRLRTNHFHTVPVCAGSLGEAVHLVSDTGDISAV